MTNRWLRSGTPLICAHKGQAATYPELTMIGLVAALDLGADLIEVDVHRTRDDHVILMHDPSVDRTTDGRGDVADFTLAELRTLDAGVRFGAQFRGCRVPTAEEALDLAVARGRVVVFDIKGPSGLDAAIEDDSQPETAQMVASLIAARKAHAHAVISSFNHECLRAARRLVPDVTIAPWMPEDRPADPIGDVAVTAGMQAPIMVHTHSLLTRDLMREARSHGIAVWAWTTTDAPSLDACMGFRPDALDGGDVVAIRAAIERAGRGTGQGGTAASDT